MTGIIALDIDGTLTTNPNEIDSKVWDYLSILEQKGWILFFITGRSLSAALNLLKANPLSSYFLSVYNGSLTLEMPSQRVKKKYYLSKTLCQKIDPIFLKTELDYVIFGGPQTGETSFFRKNSFPKELESYTKQRASILKEKWRSTPSFEDPSIPEYFPSIKAFGARNKLTTLSTTLKDTLNLHAPIISDPIFPELYLLQGTHSLANKGNALKEFIETFNVNSPVIAAGNDLNDLSLFQYAHLSITFETAPISLQKQAQIIIPSAEGCGIIQGLQEAVNHETYR